MWGSGPLDSHGVDDPVIYSAIAGLLK